MFFTSFSLRDLFYDDILVSHTISGDYGGWIHMNVTKAAQMWDIYAETNQGLYLTVTDILGMMKPQIMDSL